MAGLPRARDQLAASAVSSSMEDAEQAQMAWRSKLMASEAGRALSDHVACDYHRRTAVGSGHDSAIREAVRTRIAFCSACLSSHVKRQKLPFDMGEPNIPKYVMLANFSGTHLALASDHPYMMFDVCKHSHSNISAEALHDQLLKFVQFHETTIELAVKPKNCLNFVLIIFSLPYQHGVHKFHWEVRTVTINPNAKNAATDPSSFLADGRMYLNAFADTTMQGVASFSKNNVVTFSKHYDSSASDASFFRTFRVLHRLDDPEPSSVSVALLERYDVMAGQVEEQRKVIARLNEELARARENLNKVYMNSPEAMARKNQANEEMEEKVSNQIRELEDSVKSLSASTVESRCSIAKLENEKKDLEERLEKEAKESQEKYSKQGALLHDQLLENERLKGEMALMSRSLDASKASNKATKKKNEEIVALVRVEYEKKIQELKKEHDLVVERAKTEHEELKKSRQSTKSMMDAMVAAHAKHEEEMQQHKMMIKDHDEMVKEHDELVKGHIDRTDRLSKAWKELDEELKVSKAANEALTETNRMHVEESKRLHEVLHVQSKELERAKLTMTLVGPPNTVRTVAVDMDTQGVCTHSPAATETGHAVILPEDVAPFIVAEDERTEAAASSPKEQPASGDASSAAVTALETAETRSEGSLAAAEEMCRQARAAVDALCEHVLGASDTSGERAHSPEGMAHHHQVDFVQTVNNMHYMTSQMPQYGQHSHMPQGMNYGPPPYMPPPMAYQQHHQHHHQQQFQGFQGPRYKQMMSPVEDGPPPRASRSARRGR